MKRDEDFGLSEQRSLLILACALGVFALTCAVIAITVRAMV